jgi:hypothetical protein
MYVGKEQVLMSIHAGGGKIADTSAVEVSSHHVMNRAGRLNELL